VILLFGVFVLLGVQYLGYAEFDLAGKLLFSGEFQRSVGAQLELRKFRAALTEAGTASDCWCVIQEASAKFGFREVRLRLTGETFEHVADDVASAGWTVRIPLANGDYAALVRPFASQEVPMVVAPFVDSLREVLVEKFPEVVADPAKRPEVISLAD
jgi:hypothetical protein